VTYADYEEERGYGWVVFAGVLLLILGTLNFIEGLRRDQQGRLMMPAYPFWSLCIFTLDVLAIYGLIAYGSRIAEA
jgi:hypothetical protein